MFECVNEFEYDQHYVYGMWMFMNEYFDYNVVFFSVYKGIRVSQVDFKLGANNLHKRAMMQQIAEDNIRTSFQS